MWPHLTVSQSFAIIFDCECCEERLGKVVALPTTTNQIVTMEKLGRFFKNNAKEK